MIFIVWKCMLWWYEKCDNKINKLGPQPTAAPVFQYTKIWEKKGFKSKQLLYAEELLNI